MIINNNRSTVFLENRGASSLSHSLVRVKNSITADLKFCAPYILFVIGAIFIAYIITKLAEPANPAPKPSPRNPAKVQRDQNNLDSSAARSQTPLQKQIAVVKAQQKDLNVTITLVEEIEQVRALQQAVLNSASV